MSELGLQRAVARVLDSAGLLWTATANGGKRNIRTAAMLKASGVKAGVPDVLIFRACLCPVVEEKDLGLKRSTQYHGLAIELKDGKKGRVSEHQQQRIDALRREGYRAEVCRSLDEVLALLRECYPTRIR